MPGLSRNERIEARRKFHIGQKGQKRTQAERERDYVDEARLYLENKTHAEITEFINKTRPYSLNVRQISTDIQLIHKRWQESYLKDYDKIKARELARIDKLEMSYWEAWEKSKDKKTFEEMEKIEDLTGSGKKGDANSASFIRTKVKKKEEGRDGNAAYLEGIRWCIEERAKIYGFHAPTTINMNWREEAIKAGIDPDRTKNDLIEEFIRAAANPKE